MAKKIVELVVEDILATQGESEVNLGSLGYKGLIKLEKPGISETLDAQSMAQELAKSEDLKAVMGLILWSKPFYKEVAVEFEDCIYTSVEEMLDDGSMLAFMTAIATQLIRGLPKKK